MKIIITILALTLAPLSFADEALDKAVKLVEATSELKLTPERLAAFKKQISPLKEKFPDEQFEYILSEMTKLMEEVFTGPKLKTEMAKVYQKHFSPEEIDELIKFFESPVSKKLYRIKKDLDKQEDIMIDQLVEKELTASINKIFAEAVKK